LLEQQRESFTIWSTIIRSNTEGKSMFIKPSQCVLVDGDVFKTW